MVHLFLYPLLTISKISTTVSYRYKKFRRKFPFLIIRYTHTHTISTSNKCLLLAAVVDVVVVGAVMALFIDSTQATYWTIPDDKLIERRAATHARVTRTFRQRQRHLVSSSSSSPDNNHHHDDDDDDMPSIDDEATLRRFHEGRILRYVRRARLPDKVGLTAICYFKRFYVDRSVMEFNPSVIALSSVYAAAKVEEVYLPVTTLLCDYDMVVNGLTHAIAVKQPVVDKKNDNDNESIRVCKGAAVRVCEDALLQTELNFLQRLDFQMICYHALRSVGYVREVLLGLQQASKLWPVVDGNDNEDNDNDGKGPSVNDDGKIVKQVCRHANDLVVAVVPLTELILTQTPAIIALATVAVAAVDVGAEKHDDNINNDIDATATRRVVDAAAKGMRSVHDEVSRAVFALRVELRRMDAQREQARIRAVDGGEGSGSESREREREVEREMEMEIAAEIEQRRVRWALQRHDPMSPSFRAEDDVDDGDDEDGVRMGDMTAERRRDAAFDDTPYGGGGENERGGDERSGGRRLSISRSVSGVKRARGMEQDGDDDDDGRGGGSSSENEDEEDDNDNGQQVIEVDGMDEMHEMHSAKRARLR